MKSLEFLFILAILTIISCKNETALSGEDKKMVETEVRQFIDTLDRSFESLSPENTFKYFLQTDEFAVATQGRLFTNPSAILDTMKVHVAMVKSESIKPVAEKIFVVSKDAAVVSSSKVITITFKNESQISMPCAITMLLVKRDGEWKIAHYHN